jgi:hypothetical protein
VNISWKLKPSTNKEDEEGEEEEDEEEEEEEEEELFHSVRMDKIILSHILSN